MESNNIDSSMSAAAAAAAAVWSMCSISVWAAMLHDSAHICTLFSMSVYVIDV